MIKRNPLTGKSQQVRRLGIRPAQPGSILLEKKNSSISLKVDCLIRATIHPQRGRVVDKERTKAQFVGNRPLAG